MSKESGSGEMFRVMERLHSRTLYSEKDFIYPQKIIERANYLSKIRYGNYDGFVSKTTNIFNLYSKTKDPKDIDPNNLMATLFALRDPFLDQTKYRFPDHIKQIEASKIIDSLLGKDADFISGKKDSSIILPSYFFLRAIRENRPYWFLNILNKLKPEQRQKLIGEINELKKKLLASINQPAEKRAVEELFNKTLRLRDIEETVITISEAPVERGILVVKKLDLSKLKVRSHIDSQDQFTDRNLKKRLPTEEKVNRAAGDLFLDLLKVSSIDERGIFVINKSAVDRLLASTVNDRMYDSIAKSTYETYMRLSSIFGPKSAIDLSTAANLVMMSDKHPGYEWILAEKPEKNIYKHVRKLTKSYASSMEDIFRDKRDDKKLVKIFKDAISENEFNFTKLNKKIALMLYQKYFGTTHQPKKEVFMDFIELPGVVETIFSLRKSFMIKLLKNQYEALKTKDRNSYISVSTPYSLDTLNNPIELLQKGNIEQIDFHDWSEEKIIYHLTYFVVENYLQNESEYFVDRRIKTETTPEDGRVINIPNKLDWRSPQAIKSSIQGLTVPIKTDVDYDRDSPRLNIYFNDTKISFLHIDVD
jgi:hypothetical protein